MQKLIIKCSERVIPLKLFTETTAYAHIHILTLTEAFFYMSTRYRTHAEPFTNTHIYKFIVRSLLSKRRDKLISHDIILKAAFIVNV